jgi:hypothetical protein
MATLRPDYLNVDFTTLVARMRTQLANSDVFADYDYEGSNITILIELMAYLGELSTFFINKIAKNVYIDTADIYENVHRLATLMGYDAKGFLASQTTLSVTVSADVLEGDILSIPAWHQITSQAEDVEGSSIKFCTTQSWSISAGSLPYTFGLPVRQGEVTSLGTYNGDDFVDNELILPQEDYGYDDFLLDENVSIQVTVNDEIWTRVSDFYDELSGLADNDEVYKFEYDKYERYKLVFSTSRSVPDGDDEIEIILIKTLGVDGEVAANTITIPDEDMIYNTATADYVATSTLTVTNSAATFGSASPEIVTDIKDNARGSLHSQFRTVTAYDYRTYLESRSDVLAATAWGEKEVAPSGDYSEYNKVHLSIVPYQWGTATINTSASPIVSDGVVPTAYASGWTTLLSEFLEPRKMLSVYEEWELPILIYFDFELGLRVNRTFNFATVMADVQNKLAWYFNVVNRNFNEEIDFRDIYEFIMDPEEVSASNNFENISGIRNLIFRDIDVLNATVQVYGSSTYPRYAEDTYAGDNVLRTIELGHDQFPAISLASTTITQEF